MNFIKINEIYLVNIDSIAAISLCREFISVKIKGEQDTYNISFESKELAKIEFNRLISILELDIQPKKEKERKE